MDNSHFFFSETCSFHFSCQICTKMLKKIWSLIIWKPTKLTKISYRYDQNQGLLQSFPIVFKVSVYQRRFKLEAGPSFFSTALSRLIIPKSKEAILKTGKLIGFYTANSWHRKGIPRYIFLKLHSHLQSFKKSLKGLCVTFLSWKKKVSELKIRS